ncbi:hypothetical protein [Pseudovibrio ascidiaceicola]|uniref:hypothetical protein n=1 Tax=Pseudovibrio ascidiaceicola TaxID=285279 RepID=UPI00135814A0|nr:hypothetical protein [Pseudovibrio ascidiaceicola]
MTISSATSSYALTMPQADAVDSTPPSCNSATQTGASATGKTDLQSSQLGTIERHRNSASKVSSFFQSIGAFFQAKFSSVFKSSDSHPVTLFKPQADEKTQAFIESWSQTNFTDPATRVDLQTRDGASAPFKFVVHTGSVENLVNGTGIFAPDADQAMKSWDTICTSVVTDEKCYAYGAFGVILDVPPENVLASSSSDLMSDINIGREDRKDFMVNVSKQQNERMLEVPEPVRKGYLSKHLAAFSNEKQQRNVDDLMENTYFQHNEVIVSTREGVQHKAGVDATGEIKIKGIFMIDAEPSPETIHVHNFNEKHALSKEEKHDLFMKHAGPIAENLGVPILFLNGESTTA